MGRESFETRSFSPNKKEPATVEMEKNKASSIDPNSELNAREFAMPKNLGLDEEAPPTLFEKDYRGIEEGLIFQEKSYLPANKAVVNGYRDGGRFQDFDSAKNQLVSTREIIVVDLEKDPNLQKYLLIAKEIIRRAVLKKLNEVQQFTLLAKFSHDIAKSKKLSNEEIIAKKHEKSKDKLLGEIIHSRYGVCRHRALLFKYLADQFPGLKDRVSLQRGFLKNRNTGEREAHAWTTIKFRDRVYLYDPAQISTEFGKTEKGEARLGFAPLSDITFGYQGQYESFDVNENGSEEIYFKEGQKVKKVKGNYHSADPLRGQKLAEAGGGETDGREFLLDHKFRAAGLDNKLRSDKNIFYFAFKFLSKIGFDNLAFYEEENLWSNFDEFSSKNLAFKELLNKLPIKALKDFRIEKLKLTVLNLFKEFKQSSCFLLTGSYQDSVFKAHDFGSLNKAIGLGALVTEGKEYKIPVRVRSLFKTVTTKS